MGKKSGLFIWYAFVLSVVIGFTTITSLATGIYFPQYKFETRLPSFCHPPKTPMCDCPSISEKSVSKNPTIPKNPPIPKNWVPKNNVSNKEKDAAAEKAAKEATKGNAIILVFLTFVILFIVVQILFRHLMSYGEKINQWCINNDEARDQFRISGLSVQLALHFLSNDNPYAVIVSCMWVAFTLTMCATFTNQRLVRDVASGSIPVSFAAVVDLLIKKSPCYAVVTSLVCAYSIALWFLPDVPLYLYMPPRQAIFGRCGKRGKRAQRLKPLHHKRPPLELPTLQHISEKDRNKSFDQLLRERSRQIA